MAQSDSDDETVFFPSQAWFDVYRKRINDSDEYAEQADDWGVDFNGDFVFEMRGIPVDELDREAMPATLREELDQYVQDEGGTHVGYSLLALEGGACPEARLIEGPGAVDAGFTLTADSEAWKRLLRGEVGVVDGMMSGLFDIDGDMQKVMQYSQAAVTLTELAGDVDAEFADEVFAEE